MNCFMYRFLRKKIFVLIYYLIGISTLILFSYHRELYRVLSSPGEPTISIDSENIHRSSGVLYYEDRSKSLRDKCHQSKSDEVLIKKIHRDGLINYLGFLLRSHSLFYCSVPKVATRTLLTFITYLHIRDDLIPSLTNYSTSDLFRSDVNFDSINNSIIFKADYISRMFSQSFKNNSIALLTKLQSRLKTLNNNENETKLDLWSIYQKNVFPSTRLRTSLNPSRLFSSNFTRVIFVRHPLERLASAYIDKIASIKNKPFSTYDGIRRAICRKYSAEYLTIFERLSYRKNKSLSKQISEPCQKIIPSFEHFIDYLMLSSTSADDVHWQPYSKLCKVCLFKYNFIGKYETMEKDLQRLILHLGLNKNDWNDKNYFKTGKTQENYKELYSNLNNRLICALKNFYKDDLKFFDYRLEDYLNDPTTIQCPRTYDRSFLRKKFLEY